MYDLGHSGRRQLIKGRNFFFFFFLAKTLGKGAGEVRVPLCNTISAALPTSSEPSAHHPTPFGVVGSDERKITMDNELLI